MNSSYNSIFACSSTSYVDIANMKPDINKTHSVSLQTLLVHADVGILKLLPVECPAQKKKITNTIFFLEKHWNLVADYALVIFLIFA